MVAIPYSIYSCGMWHFLAFHEWQEVHRFILPPNLSTCWSHNANYSCHIQYNHGCLFGGWIMTISWHRWQAPKYLWFCASSKFNFIWQCCGSPCIFMHEELGHVWVWSSLKRNGSMASASNCQMLQDPYIHQCPKWWAHFLLPDMDPQWSVLPVSIEKRLD